jgi:hypothetical protein
MKVLVKTLKELKTVGRWDIDFHLPPIEIEKFPKDIVKRIHEVAIFPVDKRDPADEPDKPFRYIDISAIDVSVGVIVSPQDLEGREAPSRARKVVRGFDLLISTCRPTRGAIALVPPGLHDEIASTGFSLVRAKEGVNPFYLHYALRLASTQEQFRKWSTGSSYPAILDSDVKKTRIPVPAIEIQDKIAAQLFSVSLKRMQAIADANSSLDLALAGITKQLTGVDAPINHTETDTFGMPEFVSVSEIERILRSLPGIHSNPNLVEGAISEEDTVEALELFSTQGKGAD